MFGMEDGFGTDIPWEIEGGFTIGDGGDGISLAKIGCCSAAICCCPMVDGCGLCW